MSDLPKELQEALMKLYYAVENHLLVDPGLYESELHKAWLEVDNRCAAHTGRSKDESRKTIPHEGDPT